MGLKSLNFVLYMYTTNILEVYLEPRETSKMELSEKVICWKPLTILDRVLDTSLN